MTTDHELDETARIARDLIRFDTSNYGDGRAEPEREAAEYVAARLRDLGLEPELIDSDPGRTSVVARVAGEDRERGALVVHGHLDVVPAIADNWSVDPFGGVIKDGMLYVQAAAGIVADSVPEMEWQETENKARAVLRAAEQVQDGLDGGI